MDIKTLLRDGKIQEIECYGKIFPVKNQEGIPMQDFSKVATALETLDQYVDIADIGSEEEFVEEWNEKELREFMGQNNDTQMVILRILTEGEMTRSEFVKRLASKFKPRKVTGWTLGGALAGMNNRIRNAWEREDLIKTEWKRANDDWECYYWLDPKYKDMIKKYFAERS